MRQLAKMVINHPPWARAKWITDAAGDHIKPPASGLSIMHLRITFKPCHQVGRAALLQPCQPGVVVDLSHRSPGMMGHLNGAELNCSPGVDQPAVCIIQGFNPATREVRAGQQHSSRSSEGLDIASGIAQGLPNAGSGAALATEIGKGGGQRHDTGPTRFTAQ